MPIDQSLNVVNSPAIEAAESHPLEFIIHTLLYPLVNYAPHIMLILIISVILYHAHKSTATRFNIFDYFLDDATGKASITKTLQMLAGLTGTWIVVKYAVGNNLSTEMFSMYLAALGVSAGWSKFVGAKYGAPIVADIPQPIAPDPIPPTQDPTPEEQSK